MYRARPEPRGEYSVDRWTDKIAKLSVPQRVGIVWNSPSDRVPLAFDSCSVYHTLQHAG